MKLGKFEINNIYCEDCYKAIKEIPDKSIDLIITDPPYELEAEGSKENYISKSFSKCNAQIKEIGGGGRPFNIRRFYEGNEKAKYLYMV